MAAKAKAGTKAKAKTSTKKTPAKKTTTASKKTTTAPKAKAKAKPKAKAKAKAKPKAKAKAKSTTTKRTTKTTRNASQAAASPTTTGNKATTVDSQFRNFTPYQPKKGEIYMSDEQLVHFKQMLNNWRRELMEEVDRTVHHMQDEAANFPDPADRATQEEEFSIELRTRDRERKLIKKIDQTIDRVDEKDYGYCDTCGIEIGLRRLEARPTATQCVDCKSLDEIKEKQIRG